MSDSMKTIDEVLRLIYGKDVVDNAYASPAGRITKAQAKAQLQRIMAAERLKAQLNMIEYYDQVPSNEVMDWKGLFRDNKQNVKYELEQLIAAGKEKQ